MLLARAAAALCALGLLGASAVASAGSRPLAVTAPALAASPARASKQPGKDHKARATVVEVSVLHGTHEPGQLDPRVRDIPELRDGPLASYRSYELLSRARFSLRLGAKRKLKLPNGRLLETLLREQLVDGSSRLVASINRPGTRDFLPLLEVKARPGQAFIVAGQSYRHGILVLVFRVLR